MAGAGVQPQDTEALLEKLFEDLAELRMEFSDPQSYTHNATDRLNELINHEELMEIYDFMIELNQTLSAESDEEYEEALMALGTNPRYNRKAGESSKQMKRRLEATQIELRSMLANVPNKQVFRFSKEMTHLSRTLLIVRTAKGFQLNLEPMQKTAQNTDEIDPETGRQVALKCKQVILQGTSKRAKSSRCISRPLHESDCDMNVTVMNAAGNKLQEIKKEVRISQEFDSPNIVKMALGERFEKKHRITKEPQSKVVIVAEKGISLKTMREPDFINMPLLEKYKMIRGLLEGGVLFNTKYVHQDLKPDNILVFNDKEKGYKLALTDFGLSEPLGSVSYALTTSGYQSPEMAACADYYDPQNAYTTTDAYRSAFGFRKGCFMRVKGGSLTRDKLAANPDLARPHPKNDSWAMGIILFEMLYDRQPGVGANGGFTPLQIDSQEINKDAVLRALLAPEREERATLKEALALHIQQTEKLARLSEKVANAKLDAQGLEPDLLSEIVESNLSNLQIQSLGQLLERRGPAGKIAAAEMVIAADTGLRAAAAAAVPAPKVFSQMPITPMSPSSPQLRTPLSPLTPMSPSSPEVGEETPVVKQDEGRTVITPIWKKRR